MLQPAQGLEDWILCRAVPKDNEALRSWSTFKNSLFKAQHLTYPRVQDNRKLQDEFTGCMGISNSAQAQNRRPGGGLQGRNTAPLFWLAKLKSTRPQLDSTWNWQMPQLATKTASSGMWATKVTRENTDLEQNGVGSSVVEDTKAEVDTQSLPCLSHCGPALLCHLHT